MAELRVTVDGSLFAQDIKKLLDEATESFRGELTAKLSRLAYERPFDSKNRYEIAFSSVPDLVTYLLGDGAGDSYVGAVIKPLPEIVHVDGLPYAAPDVLTLLENLRETKVELAETRARKLEEEMGAPANYVHIQFHKQGMEKLEAQLAETQSDLVQCEMSRAAMSQRLADIDAAKAGRLPQPGLAFKERGGICVPTEESVHAVIRWGQAQQAAVGELRERLAEVKTESDQVRATLKNVESKLDCAKQDWKNAQDHANFVLGNPAGSCVIDGIADLKRALSQANAKIENQRSQLALHNAPGRNISELRRRTELARLEGMRSRDTEVSTLRTTIDVLEGKVRESTQRASSAKAAERDNVLQLIESKMGREQADIVREFLGLEVAPERQVNPDLRDRYKIEESLRHGGAWIVTAWTWLQCNVTGGEEIPWDSARLATVPFYRLQQFALTVAVAAVAEDRKKRR